jgi:RNA polymerase sigma-70 factor (ECF subfamily)
MDAVRTLEYDPVSQDASRAPSPAIRVRAMVEAHHPRIWALLRRLGVPPEALDDAAQQVFIVAARQVERIDPARERVYLQGIAVKVASGERRAERRRDNRRALIDPPLLPDELLDQKRARELLDEVLDAMPFDLRTAFVLFELDELTVPEIATLLEIPTGTASSRLRRAREAFRAGVDELRKGLR